MPAPCRHTPLYRLIVPLWLGAGAVSGCGPTSTPPPDDPREVLSLSIDVPFTRLDVPDSVRPHAPEPSSNLQITGWSRGPRNGTWQAAHPIRTRNLYYLRPSPGMEVVDPEGEALPHRYVRMQGRDEPVVWSYDDAAITLHDLNKPPEDQAWHFRYPAAIERERRLNLGTSGLSAEDFVRATVQVGVHSEISRQGLLLPAPGEVAWDIVPPQEAFLQLDVGMVAPEWRDAPPSDGAVVTITWTPDGDAAVELFKGRVGTAAFQRVEADLSRWGGTAGRLDITSAPGPDARFDYVFLADPVVAPRKATPRRVFLVFIDTLRPDHLGAWGYHRDTSPALDAIAARGVRFSHARSIAPWTLPSARTLVTGQHPERYASSTTLPSRLREEGFATAMFAGNLYLGPNFDMQRGWGRHDIELLPPAKDQVDRALAWLDDHDGRDLMMMVHLMDPHLPYKEPQAYTQRYRSAARPSALRDREFHRPTVLRARPRTALERQYFQDRYDANIRYADDQLARLFARLEPTDLVVVVSDHGEEFWDHGDFEHGHTLHEELLRVPMLFAGAGLPIGEVLEDPASLLDVTPTILDVLGLSHDGLDGTSLLPIVGGDPDARAALATRPLGVGRPLYGGERWGVVDGGYKYLTHAGEEQVFDLRADPMERRDLSDQRTTLTPELRDRMGEGLDREIDVVLRLTNRIENRVREDMTVTLTVPGGIDEVWMGDDPTEHSLACPTLSDDSQTLTVTWPAPWRGAREVFARTHRPLPEIVDGLTVVARAGEATLTPTVPPGHPAIPGGRRTLTRGWVGGRTFAVGLAVVPRPTAGMGEISGYDAETAAELQAMGYVVGDGGAGQEDDGVRSLAGCPEPESP